MPDLTKLQFYSGNNYLKRSQYSGDMTASIANSYTVNETSTTHNLGYIPQYIIAANYHNNGIWWVTEYVGANHGPGGSGDGAITISPQIDTSRLYLRSSSDFTGSISTASVPVKYVIYLDS